MPGAETVAGCLLFPAVVVGVADGGGQLVFGSWGFEVGADGSAGSVGAPFADVAHFSILFCFWERLKYFFFLKIFRFFFV